jgi:outer membrane protein OmpA-like peptidoglycan-associated protein
MFSQDDDGSQAWVLALVFGLIAGVLALVIGISISHRAATVRAPSTPVAAVPLTLDQAPAIAAPAQAVAMPPAAPLLSAAQVAQAASDAASVKVEQGVVKFYFASNSAALAAGAGDALADMVKGGQAGRKLVISGYHDAVGDPAYNAALARRRALAVRDALKKAGVDDRQIELKKPEQVAGTDSDAEARRVEISLQ